MLLRVSRACHLLMVSNMSMVLHLTVSYQLAINSYMFQLYYLPCMKNRGCRCHTTTDSSVIFSRHRVSYSLVEEFTSKVITLTREIGLTYRKFLVIFKISSIQTYFIPHCSIELTADITFDTHQYPVLFLKAF